MAASRSTSAARGERVPGRAARRRPLRGALVQHKTVRIPGSRTTATNRDEHDDAHNGVRCDIVDDDDDEANHESCDVDGHQSTKKEEERVRRRQMPQMRTPTRWASSRCQ